MKNLATLFSLFVFPFFVSAQGNIMLLPFEPLMNATWKAEGKWKDGKPFKQDVAYAWSASEQEVSMTTDSYLDSANTKFGRFATGVHVWDSVSNSIRFKITDIHGKVIDGTVVTKQKTIMYKYNYPLPSGEVVGMTDALIWIKPDKYMYKVGTMEGEEWKEVYLETYFFKK